jgi:hypothetical protein
MCTLLINPLFIVLMGGAILVTTFLLGIPQQRWFDNSIPSWVVIANIIYFDVICAVFFTRLKERLSKRTFKIIVFFFFISSFFIKVSFSRLPLLAWLSAMILLFIFFFGKKAQIT